LAYSLDTRENDMVFWTDLERSLEVQKVMGEQLKYWVGFNKVPGIGPMRLKLMLESLGDIEAAWNASYEELKTIGLGRKTIEDFIQIRSKFNLEEELGRIYASGYKAVSWDSDDYPIRLKEIDSPPPVLFVWGDLDPNDRWAVAIVGTRRMSAYGESVTQELSSALAMNGITIISGMARGVDGVAHQTALNSGGRTIAVLGSGFDHLYPPEHRRLAKEISENGAVITDYPLGTRPEARNFPPRNRIISGLALVVVIVEAGEGSGALITANFAADQGREVFAVPGKIHSKTSIGTNKLIKDGATPLLAVEDVLEALNFDIIVRQEVINEFLPEDDVERMVYEKLSYEPVHVDTIQAACGLPVSKITASLAMLELKGRARQVGGMQYIKVSEMKATYRVE
jgi:DNA processing protein